MVKNGVVAMLFWANGVIFLLFLLGITSVAAAVKDLAAAAMVTVAVVIVVYCIRYIILL